MILPTKSIERSLVKMGAQWIAAVDEAGRGSWAGPVVAGAVLFNASFFVRRRRSLVGVRDSKLLTPKARAALFEKLTNHDAIQWGIAMVDSKSIDAKNIHNASLQAMQKVIALLSPAPDIVLIDGTFPIPDILYPQKRFPHGDRRIFSIAAASIIAKVTRDRLMTRLAKKYPEYGFERHKGYGTKFHHIQLALHGPSPIHRMSYRPVAMLA